MSQLMSFIRPFIVALIGTYFVKQWNVFDHITFIPSENAFDIGVAVYFSVTEIAIEHIIKLLVTKFFYNIDVVLYSDNHSGDIAENPRLTFNSEGYCKAKIDINVRGMKKRLSQCNLIIKNPTYATIQPKGQCPSVSIDSDNNYRIDLSQLGGNNDYISTKVTYEFLMIKEQYDAQWETTIKPELVFNNKPWYHFCYKLKSNIINIRT